jgi:hypothetical protein
VNDWFGVRTLLHRGHHYRERVTLWLAPTDVEAFTMAEDDARRHADGNGWRYMDYAACSRQFDEYYPPVNGGEVYSLMRESDLRTRGYANRFLPPVYDAARAGRPVKPGRYTPHRWFAVRSLYQALGRGFDDAEYRYEERITIWRARSPERAAALASGQENRWYEHISNQRLVAHHGVVALGRHRPGHGDVVFTAERPSDLDVEDYLDTHLDTGYEYQGSR